VVAKGTGGSTTIQGTGGATSLGGTTVIETGAGGQVGTGGTTVVETGTGGQLGTGGSVPATGGETGTGGNTTSTGGVKGTGGSTSTLPPSCVGVPAGQISGNCHSSAGNLACDGNGKCVVVTSSTGGSTPVGGTTSIPGTGGQAGTGGSSDTGGTTTVVTVPDAGTPDTTPATPDVSDGVTGVPCTMTNGSAGTGKYVIDNTLSTIAECCQTTGYVTTCVLPFVPIKYDAAPPTPDTTPAADTKQPCSQQGDTCCVRVLSSSTTLSYCVAASNVGYELGCTGLNNTCGLCGASGSYACLACSSCTTLVCDPGLRVNTITGRCE
jgi:hypothetical protein